MENSDIWWFICFCLFAFQTTMPVVLCFTDVGRLSSEVKELALDIRARKNLTEI